MVLFAFPRSPQPDVLSLWIRQQEQLQSSGELIVNSKKIHRKVSTWRYIFENKNMSIYYGVINQLSFEGNIYSENYLTFLSETWKW